MKLPVDIVYKIICKKGIYGKDRANFAKKFNINNDWTTVEDKIKEVLEDYRSNPDKYLILIAKSPRLVIKYIENGKRFSPQVEKVFVENAKKKLIWAYYYYCEKFNIIVDDYEQTVTEVALNCDNIWYKKDYLSKILNKRKEFKEFLKEYIKNEMIKENNTVEELLESL